MGQLLYLLLYKIIIPNNNTYMYQYMLVVYIQVYIQVNIILYTIYTIYNIQYVIYTSTIHDQQHFVVVVVVAGGGGAIWYQNKTGQVSIYEYI